jgi:hypothetical protein
LKLSIHTVKTSFWVIESAVIVVIDCEFDFMNPAHLAENSPAMGTKKELELIAQVDIKALCITKDTNGELKYASS